MPSAIEASAKQGRKRMSAEARREQIVELAIDEFATRGLHGASLDAIAERAGITDAYLYRIFGTKRELFIACYERHTDRILAVFREAATSLGEEASAEERRVAMGDVYRRLLADRRLLRLQLQGYAACDDPQIEPVVRGKYGEIYGFLRTVITDPDEARAFVATGMLLNVAAAMNFADVAAQQPWCAELMDSYLDDGA